MLAVLSWDDRVIGRWRKTFGLVSFILLLSVKIEGHKKPTLPFEKRGEVSLVVWSTFHALRIIHIMGYGWITVSS